MKKNVLGKIITKGNPGYLDYQKKIEIFRTILYFAIVAALFGLGYSQTHSNKNLLTIVAVVGCLPASKALVGVITRFPYHSIEKNYAREIGEKSTSLTVIYDLVLTSNEKIIPIDCIVISGDKVFGYASSEKTDEGYAAGYIRKMLSQNQLSNVSVRILHQYNAFLSRAEGLNNIAIVEKSDQKALEQQIANVILSLSL